jgi:hypothetical protein
MNEEMKRLFAAFEVLEGINPQDGNFDKIEYYPHDGTFMLKLADGSMAVVNVTRGESDTAVCCSQFQMCYVGAPHVIEADDVMTVASHKSEVEEMRLKYQNELEVKKTKLEDEYAQKQLVLKHEHELKMKELETEMPKRFEQGEWVSGKTLSEIIKTLVTKQ